jgi:hypothetical protein
MKTNYFRTVFEFLILGLLVLAVSGGVVFAQGKGHGGGHGNGNGNGNGGGRGNGGGGGNQGNGGGGGGQRQWGGMPPGQQRKVEVRQQPQPQFQQPQFQRGGGWQRRQQPQQQIIDRQLQQQRQNFRQPVYVPQQPMYQARRGRGNENEQGNGNDRWRREQGQVNVPWFGGGRIPPGQIRSQEVHARNEERKAERDYERSYRGYQNYEPYYSQPRGDYRQYRSYQSYSYAPVNPYLSPNIDEQYYQPYSYRGGVITYSPLYIPNTYAYEPYSAYDSYGYDYSPYYSYDNTNFGWKTTLLRSLIGFVLGNNNSNYYGQPYDAYSGYSPGYYGYNDYANYYPTRSYYSQTTYYSSSYDNPLIETVPIEDLIGPSYGGYSTHLLREVLAQGYEQGYWAGYHHRRDRDRRRYLRRIVSQDDDYYDPYAYSIGENRRIFAEGYALGYQDAINSNRRYISNYDGSTDLYSLLMSNVIGF